MTIRICVLGAGRVGKLHTSTIRNSVRDADVVAIVDQNTSVLETAVKDFEVEHGYHSLSQAIESCDFDAVVITTPTFTHKDLTLEAAAAGKHVYCEKPMALNLDECDQMISACEKAGTNFQIGFMRRFDPEFVSAKARIDAGDIGDPMLVKSLTHGPGLPPTWAWKRETSNGLLAEVNSHCWDSVRWMMGSNYERVYAEIANLKGPSKGIEDPEFYDNAVVSIKFENGGLGSFSGICPCDYGYDGRMEIVGTKGIIQIGELKGQAVTICNSRMQGLITPIFESWQKRHAQAYIEELRHFVDCIKKDQAPRVTGEDGKWAVAGVLAATKSFEECRPINLTEVMN